MPKGIRGVQDESLELKINTGKGGYYPLKQKEEEEEENDEKEE